jgi:hypothetical protein
MGFACIDCSDSRGTYPWPCDAVDLAQDLLQVLEDTERLQKLDDAWERFFTRICKGPRQPTPLEVWEIAKAEGLRS